MPLPPNMPPVPQNQPPRQPLSETTWLEGIASFETRQQGNTRLLFYTLANGHRYVLPLSGHVLKLTQQAVSPVVIAGSGDIPSNGHGA